MNEQHDHDLPGGRDVDVEPEQGTVATVTWPREGYDGPPPWELDNADGEVINHNRPTLTYGSAGPDVAELVRLLAKCGLRSNTIAQGTNTIGFLDQSVMADVHAFRARYRVANAPDEFAGREVPGDRLVDEHVGPYIWQALYHVAGEA